MAEFLIPSVLVVLGLLILELRGVRSVLRRSAKGRCRCRDLRHVANLESRSMRMGLYQCVDCMRINTGRVK